MMGGHHDLDAHEQPSDELRLKWKSFAKVDQKIVMNSPEIDDLRSPEKAPEFVLAGSIPTKILNKSFNHICPENSPEFRADKDAPIYYHPLLPGLLILPNIIPPEVQKTLLRNIIHRDLNQPHHQTNMHLHFKLPYPPVDPETGVQESFFSYPPDSDTCFEPKDPSVHKPLTFQQVFNRKLHWVTLGGQYDWTNRVYPGELPPEFPKDISGFLETLFPETLAQAAIVNFYTPGDTMMMHRDVSEETDKGLISLSIGCDSLFMICPEDWGKVSAEEKQKETKESETGKSEKKFLLLRLRSGDVIYMTKESRFAWHGVPKIFKGTCPEWLEDWPAEDGKYEAWRGWMKNKRININVRQMRD
ncbi:hypothetical protein SMACR_03476 [Sordaria macrospora]|uniref:mRNA N(6)-methyladenine demethylase n=2 Tax=Sordaria macrospora TaxID=5147 RepID=F7VW98_SORMK|nr:uncharacterized protein SMAC_03476 [Sordaria macrospora k-hell]KAA8633017.1 hypothetical protein SMACR_03476 [Sordaria macrospora]KAH7629868.1 hypothetical protein B0T09DRAFT_138150 [Sordaria sp. MPI-SDFR-AT-0083]WPJ66562.1 hypothetical protein SMAC4_03476 [Sordaria macrospora]CCC09920.1 unnamed protein product [Sordaria macrospora k-hell]